MMINNGYILIRKELILFIQLCILIKYWDVEINLINIFLNLFLKNKEVFIML